MTSVENLVSRYVAAWNEPDPSRRRQAIAARITGAHDRFVRSEGYVFSAAHTGAGHHDAVTFSWEMRPAGGGPVAARGFHFFVLDADGRIRRDYQFAEPLPSA